MNKLSYHPKEGNVLIGEKAIGDVMPKEYIRMQKNLLDYLEII